MLQSRVIIEKVPVKQEHLMAMDYLGKERGQLLPTGRIEAFREPNVTFMVNDEPMASGGLLISWSTMGEIWLYVSKKAGKSVIMEIRAQLVDWMVHYKLRRVQACVREDWPAAKRFAEWVGFEYEARMRHFGPDCKTYLLYAVIL